MIELGYQNQTNQFSMPQAEKHSEIKDILLNFLVPIICVVLIFICIVLVIMPASSEIQKAQVSIKDKTATLNSLNEKLDKLNGLVVSKDLVERKLNTINKALAPQPLVPEFLTQIDAIARESGLEVKTLGYSVGNSGSTAPVSTDTNTKVEYKTVFVTFSAEGDLAKIGDFLSKLEGSARLVNVDSYKYSAADSSTKAQVNFTLSSPYLSVESKAVTDDTIKFDITDPKFNDLMTRVEKLKFYNINAKSLTELNATPDNTDKTTKTTQ